MMKNDIKLETTIHNDHELPDSYFDGVHTKTSLFITPTIGLNIYATETRQYFVNAFLDDKEYEHTFIAPIFILLKTKNFREMGFNRIYNSLRTHKNFITDYDCGSKDGYRLVMIVVQCPEEFRDDYYRFKRGKYSEFSRHYQNLTRKEVLVEGKRKLSIVYGVLNREDYILKIIGEKTGWPISKVKELKEIWGLPHREREYYRYSKPNTDDTAINETRYSQPEEV